MQLFFNILTRAAELGLIAIGLTMVYDLLRFASFAHTEFAMVGAYLAYFFKVGLGMNFVVSAFLAVVCTGLLGVVMDRAIFRRLRGRQAATLMVASIGLAIVLRSAVTAIWGGNAKDLGLGVQESLIILGARITPTRIWVVLTALVGMTLFHLFLHFTPMGKAIRATSDNKNLAEASGINSDRIVMYMWFIACAFAGIGGILLGIETQLQPTMGQAIMLSIFAVAILGGIGNVYGAMVGALLFAAAENIGLALNFGSLLRTMGHIQIGDLQIPVEYKPAIAFLTLILVLLFRPRGVLGRKEG